MFIEGNKIISERFYIFNQGSIIKGGVPVITSNKGEALDIINNMAKNSKLFKLDEEVKIDLKESNLELVHYKHLNAKSTGRAAAPVAGSNRGSSEEDSLLMHAKYGEILAGLGAIDTKDGLKAAVTQLKWLEKEKRNVGKGTQVEELLGEDTLESIDDQTKME